MLTKEALENLSDDSWRYLDKNGNIVEIPNEWWETEEGRKKIESMGVTRESAIMY